MKLETKSRHGNIKERAAYYIIRGVIEEGRIAASSHLIESSSGNLDLSLGLFTRELSFEFTCLIDPTMPLEKAELLEANGIHVECVELGGHLNYRDARIVRAAELGACPGWTWTRRYDNLSNAYAHFETTGPVIYAQMDRRVDFVVCSIGSGDTLCGIGLDMKICKHSAPPAISAVEPSGSTIFETSPAPPSLRSYEQVHSWGVCHERI